MELLASYLLTENFRYLLINLRILLEEAWDALVDFLSLTLMRQRKVFSARELVLRVLLN